MRLKPEVLFSFLHLLLNFSVPDIMHRHFILRHQLLILLLVFRFTRYCLFQLVKQHLHPFTLTFWFSKFWRLACALHCLVCSRSIWLFSSLPLQIPSILSPSSYPNSSIFNYQVSSSGNALSDAYPILSSTPFKSRNAHSALFSLKFSG